MVNKILASDLAINTLLKYPIGQKLDSAITEIEKIQRYLAAADAKTDENGLNGIKAATMAVFAIIKKNQTGKTLSQFDDSDWKDVINSISEYVLVLPDSEYSVFIFGMYERFIRSSVENIRGYASQEVCDTLVGLADELQSNAELFHNDSIDEIKYTEECLWIALEAMFKLLAATCLSIIKDETLREFSNALIDFAFEYGRLMLYKREQEIITAYINAQYELDSELEHKYACYVEELRKQTEQFSTLIDNAFDANFKDAFLKSVLLAQMTGVEDSQILKSNEDIDEFFLN
ncbi:MAG: hypothetical protein PUF60_00635 [Firmicutes bacterium]|nr:hypothetical protein [Bacillota bacterium]